MLLASFVYSGIMWRRVLNLCLMSAAPIHHPNCRHAWTCLLFNQYFVLNDDYMRSLMVCYLSATGRDQAGILQSNLSPIFEMIFQDNFEHVEESYVCNSY